MSEKSPYFSVVYRNLTPEEAEVMVTHPRHSASGWLHALDVKNAKADEAHSYWRTLTYIAEEVGLSPDVDIKKTPSAVLHAVREKLGTGPLMATTHTLLVPEGWKLVPIKHDQKMAEAAVKEICYGGGFTRTSGPGRTWDAMIANSPEPPALQRGRMSDQFRSLIEGMSVSVDVSTCDDDADHRYFGKVTEVMDDRDGRHGVILLVQDAEPNFKPLPQTAAALALLEEDVERAITLMTEREYAEHFAQSDLGKRLEDCLTNLHNELNEANNRLDDIPEGCTPKDAEVLRKANHALAQESHNLQVALKTIAEWPISDKLDMDAMNMSETARNALSAMECVHTEVEQPAPMPGAPITVRLNWMELVDAWKKGCEHTDAQMGIPPESSKTGEGLREDFKRHVGAAIQESLVKKLWKALGQRNTEITLGVGDGTGSLFVHGEHEAIKRVQDALLENEKLRAQTKSGVIDGHASLEFANAGELAFYDLAVQQHCAATHLILDGKADTLGSSNEPWGTLRDRLQRMVSDMRVLKNMEAQLIARETINEATIEIEQTWARYTTGSDLPSGRLRAMASEAAEGLFDAGKLTLKKDR